MTNDAIRVDFERGEFDALVALLRAGGWGRTCDMEGPALDVLDLRAALQRLEAAGRPALRA